MITAISGDEELKIKAIEAGATEFINKPLEITEFTARVKNLIDLRMAQLMLKDKALASGK
jgi:putative two-component system response regulator